MTSQTCLKDGWHLADTPPNTSRPVNIAFDDGSTGPDIKGFYDDGCWWLLIGRRPKPERAGDNEVFAWKEPS